MSLLKHIVTVGNVSSLHYRNMIMHGFQPRTLLRVSTSNHERVTHHASSICRNINKPLENSWGSLKILADGKVMEWHGIQGGKSITCFASC